MSKLDLRSKNITLIGIDCNHPEKLLHAATLCERQCEFTATRLLTNAQINDSRIVSIPAITSAAAYNDFVMKKLTHYVETEFALIIQHDGYIQNPQAWTDLFLRYDYIGAPWGYTDTYRIGNGGFSLRSKKLLDLLANDASIKESFPEDHHIGRTYRDYLEKQGIRFATDDIAARFSIEGNHIFGFTWNGQFGFHDPSCTLGIKEDKKYSSHKLSAIISTEMQRFVLSKTQPFVGFEYFAPSFDDTIEIDYDNFLKFLYFFLFEPLRRASLPEAVTFTVTITDSEDCVALLIRQKPGCAQISVKSPSHRKTKLDALLHARIPKKQRVFETVLT